MFTQEVNFRQTLGLANWEIRPWIMKKKKKCVNQNVFLQYKDKTDN